MRRLQHAEFFVAQKPAHGDLQEASGGTVVAVEDYDVGSLELRQGMVDVAGLGVLIAVARHVADGGFFGELTKLFAPAVVEQVDVEPVGGPVDVHCCECGVLYDAERLVIGGDEEIDRGPLIDVVGQRDGGAAQRPEGLEVAEKENTEGIYLGEEQEADKESVEKAPGRSGVEKKLEGGGDSPIAVTEGGEHRGQHQSQRDEVGAGAAISPDDQRNGEDAQNDLLGPGEFQNACECQ